MVQTIHQKIETLLRDRGFEKKDLAAALGITSQNLGEILKGRKTVTLPQLSNLVQFFGLRADYWLDDNRKNPTAGDVVQNSRGQSAAALRADGISRIADAPAFQDKVREFVLNHPAEWTAQFGPLTREELEILGVEDEEG